MKVVIAGSAKLQDEIQKWIQYWNSKEGYLVLDYPRFMAQDEFENLYPDIHKNFFKNITQADILFIANEAKDGVDGYIGAETFAELDFGLAQRLINEQNIKLILARMPSKKVNGYDEIVLWKKLGWIDELLNNT